MAFTLTTNHGGSGGGATFSIGTAANTGDLMVVGMLNFNGNSLTITAVTDTVGTSYSKFNWSGGGNSYGLVWGFLGGTGANTLSVTWSSGSTNAQSYAEFTGSSVSGATTDGTTAGATGSGTSMTTPTITTTGADCLVLNYIESNGGSPTFGGSWSAATTTSGGIGYQADVGAATYTPSATATTGVWGSGVVAFKAASAATPQIFVPRRMPLGV